MNPARLLVTGCSGFVGSAVVREALKAGYRVTGTSRRSAPRKALPGGNWQQMPDFADPAWLPCLQNHDIVVHCAARVHQVRDTSADPMAEFTKANADATRQLARQARLAGVKRFIFLSTIKVNGDLTYPGQVFEAGAEPQPTTPYGISKRQAEEALIEESGDEMAWIIVRPPLVFGPGAKGNLALLSKMAKAYLPLPLGHIRNARSLLSLENLVEFLLLSCITPAVNRIYLLADPEPLTTAQIYDLICLIQNRPALSFNPPGLLQWPINRLIHALGWQDKLSDSLVVDTKTTKQLTGWQGRSTLQLYGHCG